MSPMPQPVEPVPARGSARHTGSASGPTATRHWRPAIGGPRQRAQKGGPRRGTARGGQAGANGQANAARPARGTYGHCAWAGCRMAQANQAQAVGRTSELRRVHAGPLAAWRASANGRAAPASSGGSTAGHWPRVAGEPMRTACERRAVQLRNACSLGRADQHCSHIEHGPSGTWLGAVGRARRESTCDAGGVQPRGRGHGEQLAQRGCQSLQGIE